MHIQGVCSYCAWWPCDHHSNQACSSNLPLTCLGTTAPSKAVLSHWCPGVLGAIHPLPSPLPVMPSASHKKSRLREGTHLLGVGHRATKSKASSTLLLGGGQNILCAQCHYGMSSSAQHQQMLRELLPRYLWGVKSQAGALAASSR